MELPQLSLLVYWLLAFNNSITLQWIKYVQTTSVGARSSKSFTWTFPIALHGLPYCINGSSAGQYSAFYFSFEAETATSCKLISNNSIDDNRIFWSMYGMIIGS